MYVLIVDKEEKMKLFCLPYAGGSSTIFLNWKKYFHQSIEICPVELSGRGTRYNEPLCKSINEMVDDVLEQIKDNIMDDTYAIFGHSMGSLITYELCHKIKSIGTNSPVHVFFSGCKAPNLAREEEYIYDLPDEEFKLKVLERGGTSKEFFEHKELYEIFMPILRADFEAVEKYKYVEKNEKLTFNISILNGKDDELTFSDIVGWKNHTLYKSKVYMLDGDHFYINKNIEQISNIINYTLINQV